VQYISASAALHTRLFFVQGGKICQLGGKPRDESPYSGAAFGQGFTVLAPSFRIWTPIYGTVSTTEVSPASNLAFAT